MKIRDITQISDSLHKDAKHILQNIDEELNRLSWTPTCFIDCSNAEYIEASRARDIIRTYNYLALWWCNFIFFESETEAMVFYMTQEGVHEAVRY